MYKYLDPDMAEVPDPFFAMFKSIIGLVPDTIIFIGTKGSDFFNDSVWILFSLRVMLRIRSKSD